MELVVMCPSKYFAIAQGCQQREVKMQGQDRSWALRATVWTPSASARLIHWMCSALKFRDIKLRASVQLQGLWRVYDQLPLSTVTLNHDSSRINLQESTDHETDSR